MTATPKKSTTHRTLELDARRRADHGARALARATTKKEINAAARELREAHEDLGMLRAAARVHAALLGGWGAARRVLR